MDSVTTFLTPSAVQNRRGANGRSHDTTSTTTSARFLAKSLKRLVLAAHTPVSSECTMLSSFFLPLKFASDTSDRSPAVSLKSGALLPTLGSSPLVWAGVPLNRTSAMALSPCDSAAGVSLHGARRLERAFADDTFELELIVFKMAGAPGFRWSHTQ